MSTAEHDSLWARFTREVAAFREETGMANAQISRRAGLGPNTLSVGLDKGSMTIASADRVLTFIHCERTRRAAAAAALRSEAGEAAA